MNKEKKVWRSKRVSMKVAKGKGDWWLIGIKGKKYVMREVGAFYFEKGDQELKRS
jgi:hypothetical protein